MAFPANLPILDGKNYEKWYIQMRMIFGFQEVTEVIRKVDCFILFFIFFDHGYDVIQHFYFQKRRSGMVREFELDE